MSKHTGNVVDPWSVINAHGADATRWYLFTASAPGEPRRFFRFAGERGGSPVPADTVERLLFLYDLCLAGRLPSRTRFPTDWKPRAELDRWLLSELNVLVGEVTQSFEEYDPTTGGRRIQEFVDRLSNWYVRRSRRRFWKSDSDEDKLDAYATLVSLPDDGEHGCWHPIPPLWLRRCTRIWSGRHTPTLGAACIWHCSRRLMKASSTSLWWNTRALAMRLASLGRSARSKSGIKVRQPLPQVVIGPWQAADEGALQLIGPQLLDELNVKSCDVSYGPSEMVQAARAQLGEQSEGVVSVDWSHPAGSVMVTLKSAPPLYRRLGPSLDGGDRYHPDGRPEGRGDSAGGSTPHPEPAPFGGLRTDGPHHDVLWRRGVG